MKYVRRQGIDYHISEPEIHNQNPVEGVIGEVMLKWYRTMVNKLLPRQLRDYGVSWLSEIMSMNRSSSNSVNGGIHLKNVTDETDKVWFNDNAGIYTSEPGRELWISHRTGRLMCYRIITQTGKVISISTVHRVTNLVLSTYEVKENFVKFDTEIHQRIKGTLWIRSIQTKSTILGGYFGRRLRLC